VNNLAINVEGLGKKFSIGKKQESYRTLRDAIMEAFTGPFKKAGMLLRGEASAAGGLNEIYWALKDVTFQVGRGEVVGIIGRNGAGKSTLLKVLSRITEPTIGYAEVTGRIGSLLEVGTGFHPELTGRENIYLNGTILGMRRAEIEKKFEEIVAFSEVEKFIDTPVKHYSSGMYLRLAFSVAAHLETEILLVDEVLAVGDAAFQRKCLGKMGDVGKSGRTILFVSHNFAAVENLCSKVFLIDQGRVVASGKPREVINIYTSTLSTLSKTALAERTDRRGVGEIRIEGIGLFDDCGNAIDFPATGQKLVIRLYYKSYVNRPFMNCRVSVNVSRNELTYFNLSTELVETKPLTLSGDGYIEFVVPELPLSQSTYSITTFLEANREVQDWVVAAGDLTVVDGDFYGTGRSYPDGWQGIGVLIKYHWRQGVP